MNESLQQRMRVRPKRSTRRVPHRLVEYAYYASLFSSVFGGVVGFSIPFMIGGMILVLSIYCIFLNRSSVREVYGPIGALFACAFFFVLVQVVVHEESPSGDDIRPFITWILGVIVVHSLGWRRQFTHRFAIVLFVIGVIALPFLELNADDRARVQMEGSGLGNPNGLGAWFGFCATYFSIRGLESKRGIGRTFSWLIAIGCVFVVGLTVSRGALLATALAITVAFRRALKRAFVPLLVLMILAGVLYESGLLERISSGYAERGMEETGRGLIWPGIVERIFSSPVVPLVGVGSADVETHVVGAFQGRPMVPHNSFLYFALSSGVVPLAFYVAFWIQAVWKSFSPTKKLQDAAFRLPFLLYTFVVVMLGDYDYMSPWAILALTVGAGSGFFDRTPHRVARSIPSRSLQQSQAGIQVKESI